MSILFEDNYIIGVNKPAGVQAESDRWGNPSMEAEVSAYLKKNYPWKKQLITGIVHRLDRQVSGVMLFAITPLALKNLNRQFELRTVEKTYLALVEGKMPEPSGELVNWLRKDMAERRAVVANKKDSQAQECRLRYKVLEAGERKSLLEVELLTGRYHQIRAQLAATSCPIIGDEKYGSSHSGGNMIHLHASRLTVDHPKTGEQITIEAPLPEIWVGK